MAAIAPIEDFEDVSFDPFIADAAMFGDMLDPYARLAQLRRQAPVIQGDYRVLLGLPADLTTGHLSHYTVLGYDEVGQVLNDPAKYLQAYAFNLGITFGRSISTMVAPEHPR